MALTMTDQTRLQAWARARRLMRPPEECVCEIGCITCSGWLAANTIYVPGDPSAQRRRVAAAPPTAAGGRSWQPATSWLRTSEPESDTETFREMHALLAAPPPAASEPGTGLAR